MEDNNYSIITDYLTLYTHLLLLLLSVSYNNNKSVYQLGVANIDKVLYHGICNFILQYLYILWFKKQFCKIEKLLNNQFLANVANRIPKKSSHNMNLHITHS